MNLSKIIVALCSLFFFMIGFDKFLAFLKPPCSLMDDIPSTIWNVLGVVQIAAGILIWLPKFRKHIAGFFMVFMIVFVLIHLMQGTYDVGGAAFMAALLAFLVWTHPSTSPSAHSG